MITHESEDINKSKNRRKPVQSASSIQESKPAAVKFDPTIDYDQINKQPEILEAKPPTKDDSVDGQLNYPWLKSEKSSSGASATKDDVQADNITDRQINKNIPIIEQDSSLDPEATNIELEKKTESSEKTEETKDLKVDFNIPKIDAVKIDIGSEAKKTLSKGLKKTKRAISAHKQTESAGQKALQIQRSLVTKPEEMQAKANASLVSGMKSVTPQKPSVSENTRSLKKGIESVLPEKVEDLKKFKTRGTAKKMTSSVKSLVNSQSNEVTGSFSAINTKPKAAAAPKATPLPPAEQVNSAQDGLASGLVPEMTEDHLDINAYSKAGQSIIEQVGYNKEAMASLGDTPLAKAFRDIESLESVNQSQQQDILDTRTNLSKESDQQLEEMSKAGQQNIINNKKAKLSQIGSEQVNKKASLEEQKANATKHMENIFNTAKSTVDDKLESLEDDSMTDFESRIARAERIFTDNVTRRQDTIEYNYKKERNLLQRLYDLAFVDIDEIPGMSEMFEDEKRKFENSVNKAIADITASNQKVIIECKNIINKAHQEIDDYQKTLPIDVQNGIKESADAITGKLNALTDEVNTQAKELKEAMIKKQQESVEMIQGKIDKIIEENQSLFSKFAEMTENAIKLFAQELFAAAGIDPSQIMAIFEKGKNAMQMLFADPIGFIKNILKAIGVGVENFGENIVEHLKNGFVTWLTGATSGLSITMPAELNLKGVFDLALQIMGLTWENIKARLIEKGGKKVERGIEIAEQSLDIIQQVREGGLVVLWDMLKDKAEEVKTTFIDGLKNWAINKIIVSGIKKLLLMANPAGALLTVVETIYKAITFFIDNINRIMSFAESVFDSVAAIAQGNIGAAAKAIEASLAKTIPLILGFLAKWLDLGGIVKKVQELINSIQKKIQPHIDKVIDWLLNKIKKFRKGKKGGNRSSADRQDDNKRLVNDEKSKEKNKDKKLEDSEVGKVVKFEEKDGHKHRLWFKDTPKGPVLMLASTPKSMEHRLKEWNAKLKLEKDGKKKEELKDAISKLEKITKNIESDAIKVDEVFDEIINEYHKKDKTNFNKRLKQAKSKDQNIENEQDKSIIYIKLLLDNFGDSIKKAYLLSSDGYISQEPETIFIKGQTSKSIIGNTGEANGKNGIIVSTKSINTIVRKLIKGDENLRKNIYEEITKHKNISDKQNYINNFEKGIINGFALKESELNQSSSHKIVETYSNTKLGLKLNNKDKPHYFSGTNQGSNSFIEYLYSASPDEKKFEYNELNKKPDLSERRNHIINHYKYLASGYLLYKINDNDYKLDMIGENEIRVSKNESRNEIGKKVGNIGYSIHNKNIKGYIISHPKVSIVKNGKKRKELYDYLESHEYNDRRAKIGSVSDHNRFKPYIQSITLQGNTLEVTYIYKEKDENNEDIPTGQEFTSFIEVNGDHVTQSTTGRNLILHEFGRGITKSAKQKDNVDKINNIRTGIGNYKLTDTAIEERGESKESNRITKQEFKKGIEDINAKIENENDPVKIKELEQKKKEYLEERGVIERTVIEKEKNEKGEEKEIIKQKYNYDNSIVAMFDNSHILANMFMGSGYKEALNLLTTSSHYNQVIMRNAEDEIMELLEVLQENTQEKYPNAYITFDMTITSTWDKLIDREVFNFLNDDKSIKWSSGEQKNKELKNQVSELAKINDPVMVKSVNYEATSISAVSKDNNNNEVIFPISHGPIEVGIEDDKTLKNHLLNE
ncbi:phage tail protein [Aureibacter tunicatorum]|uniref:Uncharacterized protein n=1 Tax=Aureibacter tunicatorum TaxID=866807 RepID=A0AAE3XTW2_9BACT|nr:hypothetical protein [Aureibacter tunicatorum]MDR6241905.1 hypothetical protein [Aureibacter tunicatorum]BDD07454.1 hypothetical protein AUTU_49370 [Aureibacter tunicatorum]